MDPVTGTVVLSRLVAGSPEILDYFIYNGVPPDQSYGTYPAGQPDSASQAADARRRFDAGAVAAGGVPPDAEISVYSSTAPQYLQ